ncbi:hypothetical protein I4U23_015494 [Adineta vaga]|nr:hypothetical protein I4U23_015494 [Adineta vaga]
MAQSSVITMTALSDRLLPVLTTPTTTTEFTSTTVTAATKIGESILEVCNLVPTSNFIVNVDGETGACATDSTVTSPSLSNTNGTLSQIFYNHSFYSEYENVNLKPSHLGNCFFIGHTYASATMCQKGNLSRSFNSGLINSGIVKFNFSAWLGGIVNQDDSAEIRLSFSDISDQIVGNSFTLGPILNADRANLTTMVFRQTNGTVPIGTRYFTVLVTMIRYSRMNNNTVVDNISLFIYM